MPAIIAELAPYLTPPNVLAVSSDFTLINIVAVGIITLAGVAAAVALRKPKSVDV